MQSTEMKLSALMESHLGDSVGKSPLCSLWESMKPAKGNSSSLMCRLLNEELQANYKMLQTVKGDYRAHAQELLGCTKGNPEWFQVLPSFWPRFFWSEWVRIDAWIQARTDRSTQGVYGVLINILNPPIVQRSKLSEMGFGLRSI